MDRVGPRVIAYGDNTRVIEGWKNGCHCNCAVNSVFKWFAAFLHTLPKQLNIITRYVPSKYNPADGPSQGTLGPLDLLIPSFCVPEDINPFIINTHTKPAAKVINQALLIAQEQEHTLSQQAQDHEHITCYL
ncbi:hypothetical protein ID866_9196 [Astraeus odoratus]|nr:hypothetical protein ID866_9196 [Astraeus odoratus]